MTAFLILVVFIAAAVTAAYLYAHRKPPAPPAAPAVPVAPPVAPAPK